MLIYDDIDAVVTWENNGYGRIKSKSKDIPIYNAYHGVCDYILNYFSKLVQQPDKWQSGGDILGVPTNTNLQCIYPRITQSKWREIIAWCKNHIVPNCVDLTRSDSNFAFLAKLSATRNWRRDCVICLTDAMGVKDVCVCKCADIIIFRPCGHAICAYPCAADYMRDVLNGAKMGSSMDVSQCDLPCPVCRSKIEIAFNINAARCDWIYYDQLARKCMDELHM